MNKVFEYMGWDKIIDCDTCDLEYCQGSNLPIPECRFQKNGNDMVQAINVMQENGDWEKFELCLYKKWYDENPGTRRHNQEDVGEYYNRVLPRYIIWLINPAKFFSLMEEALKEGVIGNE